MNLKLFCAVERVNGATISPVQSKDCLGRFTDRGEEEVLFEEVCENDDTRTRADAPGSRTKEGVLGVSECRFCRMNDDQSSGDFLRTTKATQWDRTERSIVPCRVCSGDEIKRRGNLRWRGTSGPGAYG